MLSQTSLAPLTSDLHRASQDFLEGIYHFSSKWSGDSVQLFESSSASRWCGLSSLPPQARKETKSGEMLSILHFKEALSGSQGGQFPTVAALTLEGVLVGSPSPLRWLQSGHFIITLACPAFPQPATHLPKPATYPVYFLLYRKKPLGYSLDIILALRHW